MADRWNESVFRAAAVASELVSSQLLDDVATRLRRGGGELGPPVPLVTDDVLADALVRLGHLNRWQVEQLKAGRSRFALGDYQIVDSIGQGGMGQVFKAIHSLLGRVEAIKVLPRDRATPEAIASFRHEIRAQALLDHPHLVRVSYAGFDGNVYYLVTEYVPGADLRRMVKANGPLDVAFAAEIIAQTAEALTYVHSRGLIHRDVKPGNVLVTPDGFVKLSDMGLAGFTVDAGWDDPKAGKIVGTADYLAPEQILTPRELTPAIDVYALGCTLYYAVTGKVPFPGGTTADKARRHCQDTPLHPRHFNPALTDEFVEIIADMMEKNLADRILTAEAVLERLAAWRLSQAPAPVGAATAPRSGESSSGESSRSGELPPVDESPSNELDFAQLDFTRGDAPGQSDTAQFSQTTQHVAAAPAGDPAASSVVAPPPVDASAAAPTLPTRAKPPRRSRLRPLLAKLASPAVYAWRGVRHAARAFRRITGRVVGSIASACSTAARFVASLPPAIVATIILSVLLAAAGLYLLYTQL